MAKRARGTMTRPGQRPPTARPANRPAATPASKVPAPSSIEAVIVAQERQADEVRRSRAQRSTSEPVVRSSSPLGAAAANEYAYVARDVRRVARVGGSLVGLLVILWVVTQVSGAAA
jgi:hypothetical protein